MDYKYKGFTICRYEASTGGVRWLIELNGVDYKGDFTTLTNAKNYIDSHKLEVNR